jgi:hypothetical protein
MAPETARMNLSTEYTVQRYGEVLWDSVAMA